MPDEPKQQLATPDFTPQAIGAFCVLVATNVIVLLGLDMSEARKAAIAGLINAAVIIGFLVQDAIVRHGRATGKHEPRMSENRKVELYRDDAGEFRWCRWVSSDVVAESGEGYADWNDAWKRASLEADAHKSEFRDLTAEEE